MSTGSATIEGQDPQTHEVDSPQVTIEQFNELQSQLELERKQRSSLDSKVSEYQKMLKEREEALEQTKQAGLSESEKLELQLKQLQMEVQTEKQERTRATNKAKALELMNENGIDRRLIDLIPLDDLDSMTEKIKILSEVSQDTIQKGAQQVVNKIGATTPTGGTPTGGFVTLDQYRQMSTAEQDRVLTENRLKKA